MEARFLAPVCTLVTTYTSASAACPYGECFAYGGIPNAIYLELSYTIFSRLQARRTRPAQRSENGILVEDSLDP